MRREINVNTGEVVELPDAPGGTDIDPDVLDTAELNSMLTAPGSVVRALAEVMFVEVNKLRVKDSDAAYTKPQFVAALKAKMR